MIPTALLKFRFTLRSLPGGITNALKDGRTEPVLRTKPIR